MPKITGGLADISTERNIAPEGVYQAKLKCEMGQTKKQPPKPQIIVSAELTGEDTDRDTSLFKGIVMKEYITLEKNDGGRNEISLRRFKQIVEGVLGEDRANDPDFDTDELNDVICLVQVIQDSYEDNVTHEQVPTNKAKRYLSL